MYLQMIFSQVGQPATRTVNLASLGGKSQRRDERDEPIVARITTHPLNARSVYFRRDPSEVVTDKKYVSHVRLIADIV